MKKVQSYVFPRVDDASCADASATPGDAFRDEQQAGAKQPCFLENCHYGARGKMILRVIMKHARRRRAGIITCRETSTGGIPGINARSREVRMPFKPREFTLARSLSLPLDKISRAGREKAGEEEGKYGADQRAAEN